MLLDWVGASSSAKNAEEIEMAKVIRALTRHGLLCHFKCYTTEAGKTLSLYDNITGFLIAQLRTLFEDRGPDFMTPELVDVLVRLYQVHKEEFEQRRLFSEAKDDKNWILKLSCGDEGSSAVRVSRCRCSLINMLIRRISMHISRVKTLSSPTPKHQFPWTVSG